MAGSGSPDISETPASAPAIGPTARNLPYVEVIEASGLNPLALAAYEHVLVTRGAVKMLEERLQ